MENRDNNLYLRGLGELLNIAYFISNNFNFLCKKNYFNTPDVKNAVNNQILQN